MTARAQRLVTGLALAAALSSLGQGALGESEGAAKRSTTTARPQTTVTIRAAVVRGGGDVVPVPRTQFSISSFSRTKVWEQAQKGGAGPEPKATDPTYQSQDCTEVPGGGKPLCITTTDSKRFEADHASWRDRADAALTAAEARGTTRTVTTDLDGRARVSLSPGTWYVSGVYSMMGGRSSITWMDVPFRVGEKASKVELSNDNGHVFNRNW